MLLPICRDKCSSQRPSNLVGLFQLVEVFCQIIICAYRSQSRIPSGPDQSWSSKGLLLYSWVVLDDVPSSTLQTPHHADRQICEVISNILESEDSTTYCSMSSWMAAWSKGFWSFFRTASWKNAARTTSYVSFKSSQIEDFSYAKVDHSSSSKMQLEPVYHLSSTPVAAFANPWNSRGAQHWCPSFSRCACAPSPSSLASS